jgi:hypothetical protein
MTCALCGEPNEKEYRFCRKCGGPLSAAAPAEIHSSVTASPTDATSLLGAPVAEATALFSVAVSVAESPAPPFKLIATSGLLSGQSFTPGPKGLSVGRDQENCEVVIADEEISRLHAWLGLNDDGHLIVRDCQSTNGTYVNGVRVLESPLLNNDLVAFGTGSQLFRVMVEAIAATRGQHSGTEVRPDAQGGATAVLDWRELAGELAAHPQEAETGSTLTLNLAEPFQQSSPYSQLVVESLQSAAEESPPPAADIEPVLQTRGSALQQFGVLVRRNWGLKFCDRGQTILLFAQAPVLALLVAMLSGGSNLVPTLFMAMFAALWFGCSNAVREIVNEQPIYKHERQTGLKIPSYIFAKLAVLAFIDLAQCASVILILLAVQHALSLDLGEVLAAILITFLVAVNGTLIGLVISSLVASPEKALALFPLVLIPELLLCGMFLPVNRIQTLVPITVEELFQGRMYGPAESKAKAGQMVNPPAAGEDQQAGNAPFAHQVAGAVAPSERGGRLFHQYTPAPARGMPPFARWLSTLAVSRWGLEALGDLCLHGRHSTEDYAYKILNSISISLHPGNVEKLKEGLDASPEPFARPSRFPLPSVFWKDKGPYLGILFGYAVVMTSLLLLLMKRKDDV